MNSMASDPELVQEFLTETNEMIENLDNDLISLEASPKDSELLNRIFRALHTVKGTSSFLGYDQLVEIGHISEDVLALLRDGKRIVTKKVMDILLEAVDQIKILVKQIEDEDIKPIDFQDVVSQLELIKSGKIGNSEGSEEGGIEDSKSGNDEAVEVEIKASSATVAADKPVKTVTTGSSTIRVDVTRLDDLMNLIGELVLERNRLIQLNREMRADSTISDFSDKISETTERIHFVTNELQLSVLKTRMTPIDRLFKKFPRMIRDIAKEMKKDVDLTVSGGETELDKTVLDNLGDPLVHLLRNSIDHGVEPPEQRRANGKSPRGSVHLSAFQEGNHIIISIKDDGRGLDVEKIKQKAIEKKVISEQQAQMMSRQDIMQLIFNAGFSTADKVSNISGRGVGMDVVRTNIRKLNGIIDLQSEYGVGTEVILKLPLTLAIMQSLMVKCGSEIFAIPLASVIETLRVVKDQIKAVDQKDVICHRDSVIPLFYLDRLMGTVKNSDIDQGQYYVVLIGVAEKRYGLVVDKLLGQEEVVIKSLGEFLGNIEGIAGGTITGDGRVRLIIDCGSVADLL